MLFMDSFISFNVFLPVCVFITLYKVIYPILILIFHHSIGIYLFSKRKNLRKYGSWAIVTGATDGIGRAYADLLAKDGLNIVLVSRSPEKLNDVSMDIEQQFHVKTIKIAVDFTMVDIYESIEEKIKDIDVGVLVNNVGMSSPFPNQFEKVDVEFYGNMLNCNTVSVVRMCRLVLVGMIKRGKGGAIINIASASGASPTPLLSVYSATKAFVDFFSRCVSYEVRNHGIIVQCVLPYFVATKMSKVRKSSFFIPSPVSYVNSALNLFGVENRTFGCFAHSLQAFALSLVPQTLIEKITYSTLDSLRKRAIKKLGKDE